MPIAALLDLCYAFDWSVYSRFDVAVAGAEEARNPQSVRVGIFAAMIFTTIFYILLVRKKWKVSMQTRDLALCLVPTVMISLLIVYGYVHLFTGICPDHASSS